MKKIVVFILVALFLLGTISFSGCKSNLKKTTYDIDCTLDGNILSGTESVSFYNHTENSFKSLKFNLFMNAFRKDAKYKAISGQHHSQAYYKGNNYGEIAILKVTDDKGKMNYAVTGVDNNILEVTLRQELFPDERATVTIEYKITVPEVIARSGINRDTINLANFYPILCGIQNDSFYECVYYSNGDPYYSDIADYKVKLKCNENFVVASSGKLVDKVIDEGKATATYTLNDSRSFAFVLSEKFLVKDKTVNDIDVKYYYYDDETPDQSVDIIAKSLDLFSNKFGKYIYDHYSVVETEFVQGGMEFPALTMISDTLKDLPYKEVIVHETAHQWWQTAVGNNEIEYGFLDEGLAEYSVVIFYENYDNYGYTRESLLKSAEDTYKVYCSVQEKLFNSVDTRMLRSLKDFKSEYEYVNMAYIKPTIMYEYLRKTIGDDLFYKSLERYYKTYKYKNATPDDLMGAFEKSGADTNGFFNSFFDGKVII